MKFVIVSFYLYGGSLLQELFTVGLVKKWWNFENILF
jgi:hypothetical protein